MKLFNKKAIALALSLIGAASSVSALAMATDKTELHEISLEVDGSANENMNVIVNVDGDVTRVDVPVSTLADPAELETLLADIPGNIREKIIANLTNDNFHDGDVRVVIEGDEREELHWVSKEVSVSNTDDDHLIEVIREGGQNKVIVMEFDSEGSLDANVHKVMSQVVHPSMISSKHQNVQFIHKGKVTAERLIRMVKHSEFTADELNKIQQALDAKR
jgi:hypothetical protein